MPYRKFVEVSVHANRGSSPKAKERAVHVLQQWIDRHGPFKAIAELQVLSTYPYLAREILGSNAIGEDFNYQLHMRSLCIECMKLVQDDSLRCFEISESTVNTYNDMSLAELEMTLSNLQSHINIAFPECTTKGAILLSRAKAVEDQINELESSVLHLYDGLRDLLDASIQSILTNQDVRTGMEESVQDSVRLQWYD